MARITSTFRPSPSHRRGSNWGYSHRRLSYEIVNLCEWVTVMRMQEGLTGTDLLAAFIMHQVLPL